MEAKVAKAKASLRAYKGHVSRKVNSLSRSIQGMSDPALLSIAIISVIEEQLQALVSSLSRYEGSLAILCDYVEEEYYITFAAEFEEVTSQVDSIQGEVFSIIQGFHKARCTTNNTNLPGGTSKPANKVLSALKPDELGANSSLTDFKQWRLQFDDYYNANGMENFGHREQRAHLRSCLSVHVQNTLVHLLDIDDTNTVQDTLNALQKYYEEALNLMTRRLHFQQCKQEPGETFSDFLIRLRLLGDNAELDNLSYEDRLASHIVAFINDKDLQKELLKMDDYEFKHIKNKCLAWEASNRNHLLMQETTDFSSTIHRLSTYKRNKTQTPRSNGPSEMTKHCYRCGAVFTKAHISECPATDKICNSCGTKGHFQKVCKQSKKGYVSTIYEKNYSITVCTSKFGSISSPSPTADVFISAIDGSKSRQVTVLPDTGAGECLANFYIAQKWNITINTEDRRRILAANNSELRCYGSMKAKINWYGRSTEVIFFLSPDIRETLLAWHVMVDLNMIPASFPQPIRIAQDGVNTHITTTLQTSTSTSLHPDPLTMESFKNNLTNSHNDVFSCSEHLQAMTGEPMHIYLKYIGPNDLPAPCYVARQIPLTYKDSAKAEIDDMVKKEILKPVTQPTDFVSPFLVVPKPNGKVRLVVDYSKGLNKFVKRPIHPFPSISDVKMAIPPTAKWFATLDATKGYWQVPLDEASQLLTTFLTPWGRYCYTRAPMGLACSGDEYCLRGDRALEKISNMIKVVDDILLYAETWDQLQDNIKKVMEACSKNQITLSPDKFNIGQVVSFVGLKISANGVQADPEKVKAIKNFPIPTNVTDLRSFYGLVNQLGSFSSEISTKFVPLRPLLSPKNVWNWTPEHDNAFEAVKDALISPPILAHCDINLPTRLLTDASRLNGLGYALLQNHGSNADPTWKLITCNSRFLSDAESRYSVGELEALAIQWAIISCKNYLFGLKHFHVITDHKPLRAIINCKDLTMIDNPRMQRILEKLNSYNFTVEWNEGKTHRIPDALSRFPVNEALPENVYCNVFKVSPDLATEKIITAIKNDPFSQDLKNAILSKSYADIKKLPVGHPLRSYLRYWNEFSVSDEGLILLAGKRLYIPSSDRPNILSILHSPHLGISKTKARARELYFWIGMGNNINQMIELCDLCTKYQASQCKEPLQATENTERPFESISADLFEHAAVHFLVIVDRYSGWPILHRYGKLPNSARTISTFKSVFCDYGIPARLRTDGGGQFTSLVFKDFLQTYNIQHDISSAHYPQSNGHAEAAVKAMKNLVKKYWNNGHLNENQFNIALLEWRNTPQTSHGMAPSQWLFGRLQRTLAPASSSAYRQVSDGDVQAAEEKRKKNQDKKQRHYNFSARKLRRLKISEMVRIQDPSDGTWKRTGKVIQIRSSGHSYVIESDGSTLTRNRRLLKPLGGGHVGK